MLAIKISPNNNDMAMDTKMIRMPIIVLVTKRVKKTVKRKKTTTVITRMEN